jgi:hypothetical protein
MNAFLNRIYSDYFMPSRLSNYEELLDLANDGGYVQTSVRSLFQLIVAGHQLPNKFLVHRHDIDTDIDTARRLFEIEKRLNIKSSFYFRLKTLDFDFMREIEEYGSEASYHYEEIATFVKRNRLRTRDEVHTRLPEIRCEFSNNFHAIEKRLGCKLTTVASHGDFANRRLNLANTEILACHDLRAYCGIACEAYDKQLLDVFDVYISDKPYPLHFSPISPFQAIGEKSRICLLTHPRQWKTHWLENSKDNLLRFKEGLSW